VKIKCKSHFSYEIGELSSREPMLRPYFKDQDGVNIIEIEIQSDDIFDIPKNFLVEKILTC
jgi:hypothetical protein